MMKRYPMVVIVFLGGGWLMTYLNLPIWAMVVIGLSGSIAGGLYCTWQERDEILDQAVQNVVKDLKK